MRLRASLRTACGDTPLALVLKGSVADIIEGLSDLDLRVVLDSTDRGFWRAADAACSEVYADFARQHPADWRVIEHGPGASFRPDEVACEPARGERWVWTILWENPPGTVPLAAGSRRDCRPRFLRQFRSYRDPYDPRRDPPINVAPRYRDAFRAYSICWHYYAPAVLAAARVMEIPDVNDKWAALRWRATAPARRALKLAHDQFLGCIDPAVCHADIQALARELNGVDEREDATNADEILRGAVAWGRLYPGRYAFYAQAPDGYDVAAVLRIERAHLRTYLLSPLFRLPGAAASLARFAADRPRLAHAIESLLQEHRNADSRNPRHRFAEIRREYLVVRDALEAWHESL